MKNDPTVRLVEINVSSAWGFVYGGENSHPNDCQLIPMDGMHLFRSKDAAKFAANRDGFEVNPKNNVVYPMPWS
jgi:hypothetical protein